MFQRFNEAARRTVQSAKAQALALGAEHIDIGHLLLGALGEPDIATVLAGHGLDAERIRPAVDGSAALRDIGISVDEVRRRVENTFGQGALDRAERRPSFSRPAKVSLEYSLRESLQLGSDRIEPVHLVLGILRADTEDGTGIIRAAGADPIAVREALLTELPGERPAEDAT